MDSDDEARKHWLVINAVRISGMAMVIVGLLSIGGVIPEIPMLAGYAITAVGLIDFFVIPQVLARKWRSPVE